MTPNLEYRTITELFLQITNHYAGKNRPALQYKSKVTKTWEHITWEQYRAQVQHFAAYLYEKGVRKGDRVAILSENRVEWMVCDMATQLLGAINVSLYTTLPASEVAYILNDSESKIFLVSTKIQLKKALEVYKDCPNLEEIVSITPPDKTPDVPVKVWSVALAEGQDYLWQRHQAAIEAGWKEIKPEDVATLIYTSGTTGFPKGVMLTHNNSCSNIQSVLPRLPINDTDIHLSFLPLSHSFEKIVTLALHAVGATIAYAESVEAVVNNLAEIRPTVLISVPRIYERMYNVIAKGVEEGSAIKKSIFNWAVETGQKMADTKSKGESPGFFLKQQHNLAHRLVFSKLHDKLGGRVRFGVSGGAALPSEIGAFFYKAGITIIEGYGLSETTPVISFNPINAPRYGTVGHIIPDVTVAIRNLNADGILGQLNGSDYPSHITTTEGEIICKGTNVMKGYWNKPEATAEVLSADGWFATGDVGKFEDGYLRITDRIKHMLVSKGGKNIYPGPIEDKFKTNPIFGQVLVIGEAREFLTLLIAPDMEAVQSLAKKEGLIVKPSELLQEGTVQNWFKKAVQEYSKTAASHEKIRDFRFVPEAFTVENGMMTPTMKLKRKVIEKAYADLIEQMYAE